MRYGRDDGNRVVEWGREEDGGWLWLFRLMPTVCSRSIHPLCGLWSAVLWCVTKLFVWREWEITTWTCCDHGDDLSPLNTFREDMDWMNLIRWCMNDEGLCMLWARVTFLCVDVHWAGTRISLKLFCVWCENLNKRSERKDEDSPCCGSLKVGWCDRKHLFISR